MAGHRIGTGRPTQAQARAARIDRRIARASTPAERAAAAFDGLRMAAAHSEARGPAALEDAAKYLLGLSRWVTESEQ